MTASSITELVTMEGPGRVAGTAAPSRIFWTDFYDADGGVPCQIDGGLKCFGHPIGASGLRMAYESYLQLLGSCRQAPSSRIRCLGLTHNLGGRPHTTVSPQFRFLDYGTG